MFYLNVERIGDKIYERYVEDGIEKERWVDYSPCMFSNTQTKTKYKDIYGNYCEKRQFAKMSDANSWKKEMQAVGLAPLGMDDFRLSYISDTYGGDINYNPRLIRVANCDIEVTGRKFPHPSEVLYEIDAITHYDSVDDIFYVFDLLKSEYGTVEPWDKKVAALTEAEGGDEVPKDILKRVQYMHFETEREMLLEYINLWEQKRPVIFTGWNIEGFDIPYIMNRVKKVLGERHMKRFSPVGKVRSKVISDLYGGEKEIFSIDGVAILDYIDLYKKYSFTNQPSYSLDYVAFYETKKGKLKYDGPINKLRENNHQRYISYNLIDVESVQAIDKNRGFIELCTSLSYYAKISISDVMSPVKLWDSIIFNSLKLQNKVIPENVKHNRESYPGAFVKEPIPASYRIVVSVDATSLYPSIIRQCNISPETIAGNFDAYSIMEYVNREAPKPSDVYSCAPNGWMYTKEFQGIIPVEITKVFKQRKEWKGLMGNGKKNLEVIEKAIDSASGNNTDTSGIDYKVKFDEAIIGRLDSMEKSVLEQIKAECEHSIIICDTNQQNRKILINALYGCLGTPYFRYYDLRNAAAITLFGQMALQWTERKVNEYLNSVCGTGDHKFVFYGDTDSLYIELSPLIEKIGEERFGGDTQKLVDFIDKFCEQKLQEALNKSSEELAEYMNSYENHLAFDREAIACPPLGSEGLGGFWKAKKRYALNVYDMEGVRYHKPHLKIMGLETQSSSTPSELRKYLKECIEVMLQEGETALQSHFKELKSKYEKLDYVKISPVKSANDIAKWADGNGFPLSGCPNHVRGVLSYRRATDGFEGIPIINDGDKVMILPLRDGNVFKEKCIAWPANTQLPKEIEHDVMVWLDRATLFEKTFIKPLSGMCEAAGIEFEKTTSLLDMFDIF